MTRVALTFSTAAIVASPAAGAETVIATLPGVTCQYSSDTFKLHGYVNITPDTDGTDVVLRIRRTSLTGAVAVGPVGIPGGIDGANGAVTCTIDGNDTPGDIANGVYVLTAVIAGGNSPSVVNGAVLNARCD